MDTRTLDVNPCATSTCGRSVSPPSTTTAERSIYQVLFSFMRYPHAVRDVTSSWPGTMGICPSYWTRSAKFDNSEPRAWINTKLANTRAYLLRARNHRSPFFEGAGGILQCDFCFLLVSDLDGFVFFAACRGSTVILSVLAGARA